MARYIVAVSGGVDSVVLLDMLAHGEFGDNEVVVAHFDHGIRDESAEDAGFVRGLAEKYGLAFETKRENLGLDASENLARQRRYAFLREVAVKYDAMIMTAHHADDIVETIAINLIRGTGWRGLAVLDSPDIVRPLLDRTKAELMDYAKANNLEWREDATNQDTKYLRNDLRQKLAKLDEPSKELMKRLRVRQCFLRKDVDNETKRIIQTSPYSRHQLIMTSDAAALELLRAVMVRETGISPTRPQLRRALHAIKVLAGGKRYEVTTGVSLRMTRTQFVVDVTAEVLS